jgi:aminoglycoside N3'-acetyltransferase
MPTISINSLKTRAKKHGKAFRRFVSSTFRSFTPADIQRTLAEHGIVCGDTVLVHSSFDAFEGFQGKPTDVISMLQDVVGDQGAVMMPTMTFGGTAVAYARANPLFDVARTPSRMGLLTELFRRSPGVVRSIHPTHPVAIWGKDANAIALGHHLASTPCGVGTPFETLLKRDGKIILLGTDISVLTFFHMLEELLEHELPDSPFTDEVFHLRSKTQDGQILDTNCRLFDPAVSRRRNLYKMVPYLKKSGSWCEAQVGGLKIIVLAAADVDKVVRGMNKQGVYCYD